MQLFAIATGGIYKYATRARCLLSCDDCQVRVLSLSILASHAENKATNDYLKFSIYIANPLTALDIYIFVFVFIADIHTHTYIYIHLYTYIDR